MLRGTLIEQLRSLLGQAQDPNAVEATGVVGSFGNEYAFELDTGRRSELIGQLRQTLRDAESPHNDVVDFELLDADFCIEFT